MPSSVPLDSRQAQLARLLLARDGPTRLNDLGSELRLTHRVVRYNLDAVHAFLKGKGLRLVRRRGVGVWIEGDPADRSTALRRLETELGPAVLDSADRQSRVLLTLLETAPDALRSETLEARLGVSRPTIRRDVRSAEAWLEQHRLHLRRLPGVGVAVRGSEVEVRAGLLALVLEQLPANALIPPVGVSSVEPADGDPDDLRGYVAGLNLPSYQTILAAEVREFDGRDPTMLMATLSLAILVTRVRSGHSARLVRGRLRSLLDHPVSGTARRIAAAIRERLGITLAPPEVAAITESLLGFVELTDAQAAPDAHLVELIDRLVAAAAARLHPSLADDDLLRANLTEHVRRLHVRLRYGLPVSNPLQHEVRKRYPDVYRVAEDILAQLGPLEGSAIPAEEIGFLTMYLAGSLERHSLRPKIRVTVVCPAGMATVWILVSRLLAEFPQLEVARVVSKTALEHDFDGVATDLVVSTVPLEGLSERIPSLVVSPLLQERDVRRLTRLVGQPAQR